MAFGLVFGGSAWGSDFDDSPVPGCMAFDYDDTYGWRYGGSHGYRGVESLKVFHGAEYESFGAIFFYPGVKTFAICGSDLKYAGQSKTFRSYQVIGTTEMEMKHSVRTAESGAFVLYDRSGSKALLSYDYDARQMVLDPPDVKLRDIVLYDDVADVPTKYEELLNQAKFVKERCGNMISEEEKKEIMGHIATATIGSGAAAAGGLAAGITGIVGAVKASKAEKEATDDRSKAAAMKSAAKVASIGGMVGGGVATIGGGLGVGFGASVWTKLKDIMPKIEDCQRAAGFLSD